MNLQNSKQAPATFITLLTIITVFLYLPTTALAKLGGTVNKETVSNQGIFPGQELKIFSGEITDDSAVVDTLKFQFSLADLDEEVSVTDDIVQARLLENGVLVDSTSVNNTSFQLEGGPASEGDPFSFSVRLLADTAADHGDDFIVELEAVSDTDDQTNAIEGTNTDLITITNLIESYGEVTGEGIPAVIAAESERIPLVHMQFAGQNPADNLGFDDINIRVRELLGEVIPGGSSDDAYGDFSEISLVRSDAAEYGAGSQTVLATIDRTEMPKAPTDSHVIKFSASSEWKTEDNNLFIDAADESHYFITLRTNIGWGTSDETANAQFFGYGDAWDAWIDTGAINFTNGIDNANSGQTVVDVTQGPVYEGVRNINGFDTRQVDKLFGDPVNTVNDSEGLDYLPGPILEFTAIGTSDLPGTQKTTIDAITVTFPETSENFVPRRDIRELTQNEKSGLSIWFNNPGFQNFSHADQLLPLSPDATEKPGETDFQTSEWLSDTRVRLKLQEGFQLRPPQDSISELNADLETNRGILPGNLNRNFWIGVLTDQTADHGDTFIAKIPHGGLHFSQGNSVDSSTVNSFSPSLHPVPTTETLSAQTGELTQAVEVYFSRLTEENQTIGAPSQPVPVIGLNVQDNHNANGTEALLNRLDIIFEDGNQEFRAQDLNPLSNTDQSGVAIYRDNNSHPNNRPGQFDPGIDERIPLEIGPNKSRKNASTGAAEDDPFTRLYVDQAAATDAVIPHADTGDSEGDDYFVVIRTSKQADNLDQFRATLGNRVIKDGIRPMIEFVERANTDNSISRIFSWGDQIKANRFYTHLVDINTITALQVNDLTKPGQRLGVGAPHLGVMGFNVADGENGDQTLQQVEVTVNFTGSTDTGDFAPLSSTASSGLALYRDDGDGSFGREGDTLVQIVAPEWSVFTDSATVKLTPSSPKPIPDSNDQLEDYYIGVRSSDSMELGDSFTVAVEGKDIIFSVEKSGEDDTGITHTITAGLPILFADKGSPPTHELSQANSPLGIVGINAADRGTGEYLEELTVTLNDVDVTNFSITDLKSITSDSQTGLGIWRDSDGNDQFGPDTDVFLTPTDISDFLNNELTLTFTGSSSDTSLPDDLDASDDFYLVFRPSNTITEGDDFVLGVPAGGFSTVSNRSNSVAFESWEIVSSDANVDNTPPDEVRIESPDEGDTITGDTMSVRIFAKDNVLDDTTVVDEVTLYLDGIEVSPGPTQVATHYWERELTNSSVSSGTHTLQARATDLYGNQSVLSDTVQFAYFPPSLVIPTLSGQLTGDKLEVQAEATEQDEIELSLAEDDNTSLPPEDFTVVNRKGPDIAGGSTFTFEDVAVSLNAETIAVVARSFTGGEASGHSDKLYFHRDNLAGVQLAGRPGVDVSLSDALAAEENFGVVVFGDKGAGSSSSNPNEPRFDPSSGETLKIIPPQNSRAKIKVFTVRDRLVFEKNGPVGEEVEWDGSNRGGSLVNNDVYIVRVTSGSKTKSFPVVVAK